MVKFFNKNLTESSNHYLDWSRVGSLMQTGTHRYSSDELIARGKIILFTALCGYLGATFNNSKLTHCSNLKMGVATSVLGAVVSHAVAIYPLYQKRLAMSKECDALKAEINAKLEKNELHMSHACKAIIQQKIEEISMLSLSNEKHGNASQTWGRRKSLLNELNQLLTPENFHEESFLPLKPEPSM